ncbi:Barwin-related endoglucanase [Cordyceps fumosorosea ARSEF 2679]|uniref:Barwin-related endoglucanase n=1 Tax=Cordyceps fumosorosea (strain ARSEF 2679) TaxID=1081104 RepID=A0A167VUQ5_CORFA|nr:Barwin-related endoglucanase [Cordyceps fumosorosea ARSEF 2679]OAA62998.1 Barwin-related endoglucanase [Cordyceps fumosorosea ARSEF 2679]
MKSFALATAALFAVVAAKPVQRRDGITVTTTEWVTEYETVTEIVDVSTTLYITPGQSVPTDLTSIIPGPTDGQFFETPSAPSPAPAPEQTSVAAPPPSSAPPPPAAPTTTAAPAPPPPPPASSSSAPPPPPAEPTTTAAPAPAPAPSSPSPAAPTASAPESSPAEAKPSGDVKSGQITWYNVGMGSCGVDDSGKDNTENIVALSHELMGTQSNNNPMCGKTITVYGDNGKTAQAVVHDKCMGCAANNIDVSEKLFKDIYGDLGIGRQSIKWAFNN